MTRVWRDVISPKALNDTMHVYHGDWMPKMDRCWHSNDGFQVCSRLIGTEIGKVEHVTIIRINRDLAKSLDNSGVGDIPWRIKQEIKNELFGEDGVAIEVFPAENRLVDMTDTYHLWVLPKKFKMPFGIHPNDAKVSTVHRGCLPMTQELINNTRESIEDSTGFPVTSGTITYE